MDRADYASIVARTACYLYAVNPSAGEVTAYCIANDGRPTPLPGVTSLGNLAGLAAR